MAKKSWEKRLKGKPDEKMVDFVESLSIDWRLYKYDIVGSIAHAQMLAEQGLITKDELAKIKSGLSEIAGDIESGKFKFDKTYEDIHMAIETALIKKIGDAGEKLHTGRSRNDQVATDIRLWLRDIIELMAGQIASLQQGLIKLAEKYLKDIMPAYTHLQRAQPISIAAYILSFVEQFQRDYLRLGNCSSLLNTSPLGSGAVAGSTLGLNRDSTAEQLGFWGISRNSLDAVSDRDFAAEFIFDCSLIAAHLSRLAEDLIIYSSGEFGFVSLDDSFCTSSSMMPQKRNPDALELIRGKCGTVYGALVGMLTILKAQPSGYNRDLQEDKVHIFSAADTTSASLDMAEAIISKMKFNTGKISSGLDEGFMDATALAEYLVGKDVPFRQAHGIVGALVAQCEKQDKKLASLKIEDFKAACDKIDKDVYKALGSANVAGRYATAGAAGVKQAEEQIEFWKKELSSR
ncbi:MAG: argininosuccinate lyase [Sedimentisphaerales bacterium]|nr:argininosuccinate lyase [Sedimentisphaerales bacterium]